MSVLQVPKPGYMDVEDLNIFESSVGKCLDDLIPPGETRRWRAAGHVDRDVWRKLGAAGILGVSVPEQYGGVGGDFRHEAIIMQELGLRDATGIAVPLHNAVVAPYISAYASDGIKHKWLPGAATGDTLLAIAMTEPGAGSDLQAMRTTATRDGDHYVLNGQKTFISNGLNADVVVVAAKTDPDAGARGISLFVVEADAPGFSRGRLLDKLGQESRDTAELYFDNVRVPAENLLGAEEGHGFRMLMEKLPQERMVIACLAMAMIESALTHTIAYVKERKAFGKPLFAQQNTQFKLAECVAEATSAKVFVNHCVGLLVENRLDAATASKAKYLLTELQGRIVDECLQLFGGYGYMLEYPIAEMYKDARGFRLYGGTSEIMKLIIARSL